jgi:protein involved in polysaccharide export with SLBB domain
MQEQPQQGTTRADRSTDASADNSLSSGSSYTEQALRYGSKAAGQRTRQLAPPEPPTEFQRFVAATTGRMLPVYGASLFAVSPASFAPLDQAPAPGDMAVGAGDELRIRIWGQINFSANLRVSREGEIYLPKAGAVHVAGLPFSSVSGHLRTALERVYRNFELSVDMGEIHSIQVYLTGQARQPGEYTVSALSTLVDAVFLSGGPSAAGSKRHVELKREGKVLTDFDLYALLVRGDKTGDFQLQSGDVLFIPATGPEVALLGSVRQAAIYELRGEETISELLDAAGGRTAVASGGRISIERIESHAQRRAFELAADAAGLATPLADGDIVRIDPIVSSYRETVTLRGSLANPGHFLWHPGMRLRELLPDRDSLVTRGYWWRRTQLGLPAPELAGPESGKDLHDELTEKPAAVLSPGAQTDWNFAVIERLNPATMATSLLPFNLGRLVLERDASQDLELQPGDVVTVFSQQDVHPPIDEQTKYVRLEGEFVHAGTYSVATGETLRSIVMRAGGLTGKAYLYGAEFTRKSTQALEQQHLAEFANRLEHQLLRNSIKMDTAGSLAVSGSGASQSGGGSQQVSSANRELIERLRRLRPTGRIVLNLRPHSAGENELPETPLEDGDTLFIPSMPATVQVMGAVLNQSAFLYRSGTHESDYLRLAGGLNREADRGQTFILRADGSVTGHGGGPSIFSSGSANLRLYPGDTIVVPEKNIGAGPLRTFMAWSQILSQLGLGAAAINVLK